LADSVEKGRCGAHAHFLKAAHALDAVGCGGTRSIYARSLSDLPSLAAKAFIIKIRSELVSARFLLSRYIRLFQQYRPILLKSRKYCQGKILAKACRRQISSEDAFLMRRRRSPKASVQVDVVSTVSDGVKRISGS
jgi:hypothetical protein